MAYVVAFVLGLCHAGVTIQPQYPAALLSSANFTYNLTTASAEFTLWSYTETRHFTNTSVATGLSIPDNPYTYYNFISTFEAGCSYYGYPLVLDVGPSPAYPYRGPQGRNSLKLQSPGCAAMIASRLFGVLSMPLLLCTYVALMVAITRTLAKAAALERGVRAADYDENDTPAQQRGWTRFKLIFGCAATAVYLALLASLLAWGYASGFHSAGGQWNAYLYLYLASAPFIPALMCVVFLYEWRITAEFARMTGATNELWASLAFATPQARSAVPSERVDVPCLYPDLWREPAPSARLSMRPDDDDGTKQSGYIGARSPKSS